jgi:hypothetical protein
MIMLIVVLACPVWVLAGVGGGVESLWIGPMGRSGRLFGGVGVWDRRRGRVVVVVWRPGIGWG